MLFEPLRVKADTFHQPFSTRPYVIATINIMAVLYIPLSGCGGVRVIHGGEEGPRLRRAVVSFQEEALSTRLIRL